MLFEFLIKKRAAFISPLDDSNLVKVSNLDKAYKH
jgi:hypothetical protein